MLCNRCDDPTCRRLDAAQASYDRHCLYMDASQGALFIAACDVAPDARTPEQAAEFARIRELRREWEEAAEEAKRATAECHSRPAVNWRQVALDGRAEIARLRAKLSV